MNNSAPVTCKAVRGQLAQSKVRNTPQSDQLACRHVLMDSAKFPSPMVYLEIANGFAWFSLTMDLDIKKLEFRRKSEHSHAYFKM